MNTIFVSGESGDIDLEESWLIEAQKVFDIFCLKQSSYGTDNISEAGEIGVIIRLNDKIKRLLNILVKGKPNKLTDETIEDTLIDIADYAIIALMCRNGSWPEGTEED